MIWRIADTACSCSDLQPHHCARHVKFISAQVLDSISNGTAMQVAGLMGVTAHKASDTTREAAQAAVERAEAALRAAQDRLQHTSGKVCRCSQTLALNPSPGRGRARGSRAARRAGPPAACVRQGLQQLADPKFNPDPSVPHYTAQPVQAAACSPGQPAARIWQGVSHLSVLTPLS